MNNLKENFDKINIKFKEKKDYYKNVIKKFALKSDLELHKNALNLFEKVEALSKEIDEEFVSTVEGEPVKVTLKKKIKEFKKIYKKLHDITKPIWRQWIESIVFAGALVFVLRTYIFGLYHVPTGSAEKTILVGDRIWGNKMIYFFNKVNRGDCVIFDNPEFIYDKSNSINYFWQKYIGFPISLLGLGSGPDNWVKRVIAIPGDTIEGRIEDGKTVIYRNGEKLDESFYVNPYPLIRLIKSTGLIPFESFGPFVVPSFLRKTLKIVNYTYDPSKSLSNQPFYNMDSKNVIRRADNTPFLKYAYSPEYEYDQSGHSVDEFGPITIPQGNYWVMGDSRKNSRDSRFWGLLDEKLIHGRASFIIYSVDSEEALWIFELLKHPIDFWTKSVRLNRFFKWIK